MIYRLALLFETFAIILCIHRIYNKKIKLDIETVSLSLLSLGVTEAVIHFELNNMITMCIYALIAGYCICKFHDTLPGAVVSVLLMLITITVLQFVFVILTAFIFPQNQELRMLFANFLVAVSALWILPVVKLYKLRELLRRKESFVNIIFCIVVIIIFMIMIEGKLERKLNITSFVLTVPLAIALVLLLNKWNMVREEKEHIKNELSVTKSMQEEYNDLLMAVRLREHGFKNHISALLSIKLSEEYEREQKDYYNSICEANKYNKLLFLGDCVVSGYLYQKFCEIENAGVTVIYEIKGCLENNIIPVYYLVEILGILIDNAVEAQSGITEKKQLIFQFVEQVNQYRFKVLNPYPHVSYDEIESWFLLGNSKKGEGRGLGLYYIKKLCADYDMELLCKNTTYEGENWIEFAIGIKKADKL